MLYEVITIESVKRRYFVEAVSDNEAENKIKQGIGRKLEETDDEVVAVLSLERVENEPI